MDYVIRRMTRTEADFAVDQAAKEGWNPGLEDARVFYETDPGGFLIALSGDRPVGCVSAVSYGKDFAFIGFFIVLEEFRGRGCGVRLGQAALEHLQGTRVIGVDGVLAQQENYERAGLRFAYSNVRYEYKVAAPVSAAQAAAVTFVTRADLDKITDYDRQCFPAERKVFLEKWLSMENAKACGWVENGSWKGYGVIRKCRTGYKIGPLFADHEGIARNIFMRLISDLPSQDKVYLDIPEVNPAGMRLAAVLGMQPVFKTARMYLGPAPDIRLEKIFGVTSFELG